MRLPAIDGVPWRVRIGAAVAVALAVLGVYVTMRNVQASLATGPKERQAADATADWVVTKAAWTGLDPYGDTAAVARREGTVVADRATIGGALRQGPHTRPPSAFVVLAPYLLIRAEHAYAASIVLNMVLFVAVGALARSIWRLSTRTAALATLIALIGMPMIDVFEFGVLSLFVGFLVLLAFRDTRDGDSSRAGVWLGIAAGLKLYPLALVAALVATRRFRAAGATLGVFAALNVVGLALPGVHVLGALHAVTGATNAWAGAFGNGSLLRGVLLLGLDGARASAVAATLALALLVVVVMRCRDYPVVFFAVALVAVLASPISWRHYDLMLIPALVPVLWPRRNAAVLLGVALYALVSFVGLSAVVPRLWQAHNYGLLTLLGRAGLVVAFLGARRSPVDEDDVDALGPVHTHGDRHLEIAGT